MAKQFKTQSLVLTNQTVTGDSSYLYLNSIPIKFNGVTGIQASGGSILTGLVTFTGYGGTQVFPSGNYVFISGGAGGGGGTTNIYNNGVTGIQVSGLPAITGLATITGANIISVQNSGNIITISGDTSNLATIGNLYSTGSTLYSFSSAISGNLASTGSVLDSKINSLSGSIVTPFGGPFVTSINVTGGNSFTGLVSFTGNNIVITTITGQPGMTGNYIRLSGDTSILATTANLTSTGANLYSFASAISGNLATTGSTLDNKINSLSGSIVTPFGGPFVTGINVTGGNSFTGLVSFTGNNIVITTITGQPGMTGNYIRLSGDTSILATTANLTSTGANLYSFASAISGNLATTGSTLTSRIDNLSGWISTASSNIVYTSGAQTVSGVKTFFNNTIVTGIGFGVTPSQAIDFAAGQKNIRFIFSHLGEEGTSAATLLGNNLRVSTTGDTRIEVSSSTTNAAHGFHTMFNRGWSFVSLTGNHNKAVGTVIPVDANTKVRITTSGEVGILTTTPMSQLDVRGGITGFSVTGYRVAVPLGGEGFFSGTTNLADMFASASRPTITGISVTGSSSITGRISLTGIGIHTNLSGNTITLENNEYVFNSIAELRSFVPTSNSQKAYTLGYYSGGDGGEGAFIWRSGSSVPDNSGTLIKPTSSSIGRWERLIEGRYINVKWFGAKADGTDSSSFINNSAAYSGPDNILYFPPNNTFTCLNPIVFTGGVEGSFATISTSYTGGAFLTVGGSGYIRNKEFNLPVVRQTNQSISRTGIDIGITFLNILESKVFIPSVEYFSKGVLIIGSGVGNAYNSYYIQRLLDNTVNLATDSVEGGWSNENLYIGGRYFFSSSRGSGTNGLRQVVVGVGNNNNCWVGAAFEGDEPEYHVLCHGNNNSFNECRWETSSSIQPKVFFSGGNKNVITYGYDSERIQVLESGNTFDNHLYSPRGVKLTSADTSGTLFLHNSTTSSPSLVIFDGSTGLYNQKLNNDYTVKMGADRTLFKSRTDASEKIALRYQVGSASIELGDGTVSPPILLTHQSNAGTNQLNINTGLYVGGNVGIFRSSPSYELDISGTQRIIEKSVGTFLQRFSLAGASDKWGIDLAGGRYNIYSLPLLDYVFSITQTGNIGIKTVSPATQLDVNGGITGRAITGTRIEIPLNGNGYFSGGRNLGELFYSTDNPSGFVTTSVGSGFFAPINDNYVYTTGNQTISGVKTFFNNTIVSGIGFGVNPTQAIDFSAAQKNIKFVYTNIGEEGGSLASLLGNNLRVSTTGSSRIEVSSSATDASHGFYTVYNRGWSFISLTGGKVAGTVIPVDANTKVRITTSGEVGILTTTPMSQLDVRGGITGFSVTGHRVAVPLGGEGFFSGTTNLADIFVTDSRLTSTGANLYSFASAISGNLNSFSGAGGIVYTTGTQSITGTKTFTDNTIFASRVGIVRTSPSYELDISGTQRIIEKSVGAFLQRFSLAGASDKWGIDLAGGRYNIYSLPLLDYVFSITQTGNIGIKTVSPATQLDVNGGITGIDITGYTVKSATNTFDKYICNQFNSGYSGATNLTHIFNFNSNSTQLVTLSGVPNNIFTFSGAGMGAGKELKAIITTTGIITGMVYPNTWTWINQKPSGLNAGAKFVITLTCTGSNDNGVIASFGRAVDGGGVGTSVQGNGTTNYIPRWSATNTLTNSLTFENGAQTTVSGNLSVTGSLHVESGIHFRPSGTSIATTLGSRPFYIFTGNSNVTWTLPTINSSVGRFYFIKNRGAATVLLTGANQNEQLYATSAPSLTYNVLSGEAYIVGNDSVFWSIM